MSHSSAAFCVDFIHLLIYHKVGYERHRFLPSRRFGGIARLYGDEALERFSRAHVCVVGVGGVGSWAVEALARTGIGRLTLIDLDNVAESNVNRQLHALTDDFGKAEGDGVARTHCPNQSAM